MGSPYTRFTSQETLGIRLWFQYRWYSKQYPPPNRVKPTILQVLRHIFIIATVSGDTLLMENINIIVIAYFYLFHPSEYIASKSERTPFQLKENSLSWCLIVFVVTDTEGNIQAFNFVILTFTIHKNVFRGEKIGHKASGDLLLCPKASLIWRLLHLRAHEAPPSTPLARFMTLEGRWKDTTLTMILKTLKTTIGFYGPKLGSEAKYMSACYLRDNYAMDLICSQSDSDIIKLIGHWRSGNMLSYLHLKAEPLTRNLFQIMIMHDNYYFLTHQEELPWF